MNRHHILEMFGSTEANYSPASAEHDEEDDLAQ